MNQKKIGSFLQQLRKEQGLTQEKLSEMLNVSNRAVSRWETGSNMPDISILLELADFYGVDIREILDGERRNTMDKDINEVAEKVAKYADAEKKLLMRRVLIVNIIGIISWFVSNTLILSEVIYKNRFFMMLTGCFSGLLLGSILCTILYITGTLARMHSNKKLSRTLKIIAVIAFGITLICLGITTQISK